MDLEGVIDITDQVIKTNPSTGSVEYVTFNDLSIPVADLGLPVEFLPPGPYKFTYETTVWPIMSNLVSIDEITLGREANIEVQPVIINITALGGEVSDQFNTGGGEGIAMLVDGNIKSKYLTGNSRTPWMMFRTNEPAIVTRYEMTSGNDAPERDPKSWRLEASNDGENWVVLDERRNITFPVRESTQRFEVENDELYQYYKLQITENNGSNLFQLSEWTLFGPKLK
jgi:hypothetical protein